MSYTTHNIPSPRSNGASGSTIRSMAAIIFFLFFVGQALEVCAQGNLLINPMRVVFEGNRQREEITLANTGQDTAIYAVSFVQYRMTHNGAFTQIEEPDPGQYFADPYLRFFPRRVTLAPGESQVVRMQVRRDPNMIDGEYRSHLYFRAVPDERPLGDDTFLEDTTAIGIRLIPVFGITIPVIIRHGQVSVSVDIAQARLARNADQQHILQMTLNRSGNRSVYGDITVDYEVPGAEPVNIGLVRGLAVYTPNASRTFNLPLSPPEGIDLSRGRLIVRYVSSGEVRSELLAEKIIILNQ